MKCVTVTRALIVRICFAGHGLITIYLLYNFTLNINYWYLAVALTASFLETMVTIIRKYGNEWKWFCPSVFCYLLCIVPAIWCYEMELFNVRDLINIKCEDHSKLMAEKMIVNMTTDNQNSINQTKKNDIWNKCSYLVDLEIKDYPFLSKRQRRTDFAAMENIVRIMEQLLLLLLILGRWFLPKGKLSHDQLSQLLLVYLGTAADIAEFFEAFKEKSVRSNPKLCMSILGIWSWSLLQFSLVLTASRARKDQSGLLPPRYNSTANFFQNNLNAGISTEYISHIHSINKHKSKTFIPDWISGDFYGIILSICLQDLPFLVFRVALISYYKIVSYTNMFFTAKNSLVIILLIYRLIVIWRQQKNKRKKENDEENNITDLPRLYSSLEKDSGYFANNNNNNINNFSSLPRSKFQYQCNDPRNKMSNYKLFIDLKSGQEIRCNSQDFELTNNNPDNIHIFLPNSQTDLTDAPPFNQSIQANSCQNLNTYKPANQTHSSSSNVAAVSNSTLQNSQSNETINPNSKIGLQIESICKEAEIFLSKNKLND